MNIYVKIVISYIIFGTIMYLRKELINIQTFILILFFINTPISSFALDPDTSKTKLNRNNFTKYGLVIDQDMFVDLILDKKNEDRNYTMGAALFITNIKIENSELLYIAKALSKLTFTINPSEDLYSNGSISIGITAFTPRYLRDNIKDSLYYITNDRPFSSLVFLSTKHQIITKSKVYTSQFVIGILGLGIAGKAQSYIHKNHWFGSTRDIPTGWKYQISNGGEPTFLLSHKVDVLLNDRLSTKASRMDSEKVQLIASREFRLGYYTGITTGITLRAGILDTNNWVTYDNYQLNFANQIIETPTQVQKEFFLQASLKPNVIIYNAHLMGQFKENLHELSFSEINHFVLEGLIGVGGTIPFFRKANGLNLLIYLSGRTQEFETPVSSRSHVWGGFQFTFIRLLK